MIQVSGAEGRLDLCFRIHQISYRRFPQNDGGDEALWLVPAFLPAAKPCSRGWRGRVWFELANLCNQYPVRPGAGLQPAERHQDKGRFGGGAGGAGVVQQTNS